jgi:hypothetical protein
VNLSRLCAGHEGIWSTRRRWPVRFTVRPPYTSGKCSLYPLNRRLFWLNDRSVPFGWEKNLMLLSGIEQWFLGFPVRKVVTIPITALQLQQRKLCAKILKNCGYILTNIFAAMRTRREDWMHANFNSRPIIWNLSWQGSCTLCVWHSICIKSSLQFEGFLLQTCCNLIC